MKNLIYSLLFLCCFLNNSCTKQAKIDVIKLQGQVFGTSYTIIYLNENKNYNQEIINLFEAINSSLSTYIPNSIISKINKGDSLVNVDHYFKEVFLKSKKIYKQTDGYFDPTVGTLVNAWGFGPEDEIYNLNSKQVDSLMQFVGFDNVTLKNDVILKTNPNIYVDFNSIAKGYAVDVIFNFLRNKNISNCLVEIGGEVRVFGNNNEGNLWKIGIDNPNTDGSRTLAKVVSLSNEAMASSGNYRKFKLNKNGEKIVHTINPKTGFAKESNLLSATVFGNLDCADADGYATAFMAMGLEKTKEFIAKNNTLKVILLYTDVNGNLVEYSNNKLN